MQQLKLENGKIVTMTAEQSDKHNPEFENADAWKVTFKYDGRQCTSHIFQSKGHNGEQPKIHNALDALLTEANAFSMSEADTMKQTVLNIADELGYPMETREDRERVKQITNGLKQSFNGMTKLFKEEFYDGILFDAIDQAE